MTLAPDPRRHSHCLGYLYAGLAFLTAVTLLALPTTRLFAQTSPSIAAVDPSSGKVGDTVTVTGTNLAKSSVAAVFLSDDKSDYKAVVTEQSDAKIVIKIPQVKHGNYNLSFQEGTAIYILPFRFTVEE
jgi:hypothetical protein